MNAEEMRIAMAEAMGWELYSPFGLQGIQKQADITYEAVFWKTPEGNGHLNLPNYTTDERHAFQAVEWLRREKGMEVYIESAAAWVVSFSDGRTYPPVEVRNQSLPLAISEAFLRALGAYVEGGE